MVSILLRLYGMKDTHQHSLGSRDPSMKKSNEKNKFIINKSRYSADCTVTLISFYRCKTPSPKLNGEENNI